MVTATATAPSVLAKDLGIYARVSTALQENGNQLELTKGVCPQARLEGHPVDVVSGSGKKTRPKFERMMLDASQKQFDLLLFWKLDRLSREAVRKTLVNLTRLDSYGVAWRSFMEP